ncbi:MAG: LysM peptidoglycan-binding protein [Arthrobacter sp.]|nr:LysM peptidoglycan-binding protein [Arthrobacter sp.]
MSGGRTAPGMRREFPATDAAMAAVILLLGLSLAGSGGSLARRLRSSSARQQSLSFEDQLGIVANTTGLILITWWAMSLVIALVSALLERSGRTGAAMLTGKFSPAFMRRLAFTAVGFQLLAAPLATAATLVRPEPLPRPAVSALWTPTTAAAEGLVLPRPLQVFAAPAPRHSSAPPTRELGGAGPAPDVTQDWMPRVPAVAPGILAARQLRTQEPAEGLAEVTVRAGDSLWSLAAARLGPLASDVDIAREWPRLYRANREVIGDSPHLLRPGQILRLPAGE